MSRENRFWDQCVAGRLDAARSFLSDDAFQFETRFRIVTRKGHLHILRWFHELGEWERMKHDVMEAAISNGHVDIVVWCVEKGYRPDSISEHTKYRVCRENHFDVIRLLLRAGLKLTSLHYLAADVDTGKVIIAESRHVIGHPDYRKQQCKAALTWLHRNLPKDIYMKVISYVL